MSRKERLLEMRASWRGAQRAFALATGALLSAAACGGEALPAQPDPEVESRGAPGTADRAVTWDEHAVIVRFADNARAREPQQRTLSLARVGGTFEDRDGDGVYDRFAHVEPRGLLAKVELPESMTVELALEALRKDPAIAYAEPNAIFKLMDAPSQPGQQAGARHRRESDASGLLAAAVQGLPEGPRSSSRRAPGRLNDADFSSRSANGLPDDPRFSSQWALHNTGQTGGLADADIDATEAWTASTGSSDVVVGIIDTGIDYRHPDLAGNLWVNPGEIAGNHLDDDGNGIVDDVHGYNAIANSGDPLDDQGHGTHCAGIIGARGGNGRGGSGVAWNVSLMAIKFLDTTGNGSLADAIEAIDYAVAQKRAGVNLRVLSNSWAGSFVSQALKEAIEAAGNEDILFVAAAGNGSKDLDAYPLYPAAFDSPAILSVTSTDASDVRPALANYGAISVDLGAPGVDILSTLPGNKYGALSGTSMATPYVAGAAALVASADPGLAAKYIKDLLMTSGDPVASLDGHTVSGKRLNAGRALTEMAKMPSFGLSLGTGPLAMNVGESAEWVLDVDSIAGFGGAVALSVSSNPPLAGSLTLESSSVVAPGHTTLRAVTSSATAVATYTLSITGWSGDSERVHRVLLQVRPQGWAEESAQSDDTPRAVPETPEGLLSPLTIERSFDLTHARVQLGLRRDWAAFDLRITLLSPSGREVVLHDGEVSPRSELTIPASLVGTESAGQWTLRLVDKRANEQFYTFEGWSITVSNTPMPGSFKMSELSYPDHVLAQNRVINYSVKLEMLDGFFGRVDVSFANPSAVPGGTLQLRSASFTQPGNIGVTLLTTCATPPGVYLIKLVAQSGGVQETFELVARVLPGGSVGTYLPALDTPIVIPHGGAGGAVSRINWNVQSFVLGHFSVEVNLSHPKIDELTVQVVSPSGRAVTLHDREGAGQHDLHRFYDVPAMLGLDAFGAWELRVIDHSGGSRGFIDGWMMRAYDMRRAPSASFFPVINDRTVSFLDLSGDARSACHPPGSLVEWRWDFGDNKVSMEQQPTHLYEAAGEYKVTLTVVDNDGLQGSYTQSITVP